jgi:hypothetical protein
MLLLLHRHRLHIRPSGLTTTRQQASKEPHYHAWSCEQARKAQQHTGAAVLLSVVVTAAVQQQAAVTMTF